MSPRFWGRFTFDPPTPETTGTQIAATVDLSESGQPAGADKSGEPDTAADSPAADPPTWNGFALEADRAGAPAADGSVVSGIALDRLVFCLRRRAERDLDVYFSSLSARTLRPYASR